MATNMKISSGLTEIPDHLLWEILLRLPTAADLARASAACVSIRRLVTDRYFLRFFRRLHGPPLLGFLDGDGYYPARPPQFHPAQPPHGSAPGARACARAADFSLSFLPSHCRWAVQDIRDGRVLLHRQLSYDERPPLFRQLVVCDPLHRRYILLPPIPEHLTPSMHHPVPRTQCTPFFAPLDEEEAAAMEETAFRVICVVHCKLKLSAIVFSSSTRQWTAAASKAWGDLLHGNDELDIMSKVHNFFLKRHYAYGCFYWDWMFINSKKMLVLDTRKMDFSMADLPPGVWSRHGQDLAIMEAGGDMPGVFGFHSIYASDLSYTIARNKDESPTQWQMEKKISLDSRYKYFITHATERYLLLGRAENLYEENTLIEYLSMDIKTLKLQMVCTKQGMYTYGKRIYANFPPSLLSSPTI